MRRRTHLYIFEYAAVITSPVYINVSIKEINGSEPGENATDTFAAKVFCAYCNPSCQHGCFDVYSDCHIGVLDSTLRNDEAQLYGEKIYSKYN